MKRYEGKRGITVKVPQELFDRLDEKRFRDKTEFQAVGLQLFSLWLDSGIDTKLQDENGSAQSHHDKRDLTGTPTSEGSSTTSLDHPICTADNANSVHNTSLTVSDQKWLAMLSGILASGHAIAISAVTSNLIAFDRLIKSDRGEGEGQTDPDRAAREARARARLEKTAAVAERVLAEHGRGRGAVPRRKKEPA